MLPKSYISISQIQSYLRCPAQYCLRYVKGITMPPTRALTVGKVVHSAIEQNYKQKMQSGLDLPLDVVKDLAATEFDRQALFTDWGEDDPGKAKDEAIALATLYHQEVAPTIMPVAVELRVEVEFENVDYNLLGFIDLIDQDGYIRDTKTASRTPSEDEADKSLQLTTYYLAYQINFGRDPAGVKLDYLVSTKTPKYVQLQPKRKRTQADVDRLLRLIGQVAAAISAGHFYPNPTSFLYSEKNCQYWHHCQKEF